MKKIISLVLAMIMVFAIGATAFAATLDSPSYEDGDDHEHTWTKWEEIENGQKRTCTSCGIVEIIYDESNPNTGASVAGMAALIGAAAVLSFKREK